MTEKHYQPTPINGIVKTEKGVFYLRDTIHMEDPNGELVGVAVTRSLRTTSISEAKDRANKLRLRIAKGDISPRARERLARRDFGAAFDLVLKIQSTKARNTYDQTKAIIDGHLRPWFCGRKADREKGITVIESHCPSLSHFERRYEEIWAEYKLNNQAEFDRASKEYSTALESTDMEAPPRTPKLRKLEHDRRFLVMALKRARNRGWIKREFKKKDFDLNEITDPIGKYIDDADVQKLIKASQGKGNLFLQVLLAVYMGMRISEILHLKKDEINLEAREIDLNPKRVKTRRRREVAIPIADDVYLLLKEAFDRAPGAYIFPAWHTSKEGRPLDPNTPQDDNSYWWDLVRKETGVNARFHDLRHSAITNFLKKGVPDFAVRKICGVSEVTMRRIYAHIEREMKDRFKSVFSGRFRWGG